MLGDELLPVDIVPETITINEIRYGEELRVYVRMSDGAQVQISMEDLESTRLKQVLDRLRNLEGDSNAPQTNEGFTSRLMDLLNQYFGDNELLAIGRLLDVDYTILPEESKEEKVANLLVLLRRSGRMFATMQACKQVLSESTTLDPEQHKVCMEELAQLTYNIEHVIIESPNELLKGLTLVDTPATGNLEWFLEASIQNVLPKVDAVVYLLSARSPLSESERFFLQNIILPREFPQLFFAINGMDSLSDEGDRTRMVEEIKRKVHPLFPDMPVLGLSALDEMARQNGDARPNEEAANVFGE